jgi:Domain of unknown function (DUF1877)
MIDLDYYRMSPADWEIIQDVDDDDLYILLSGKESDAYLLQSWHVVHYLLTDTNELINRELFAGQVLGKVVTGSSDILIEDFNDPAIRYLKPDEVQAVSEALTNLPFSMLSQKFSVDAFIRQELYPWGGRYRTPWNETTLQEAYNTIQELYPQLVECFQQAAYHGDVVVSALV